MNYKINLTTDEFIRTVRKYCPDVRFEPTTFTDLALGGYVKDRFIGSYPAKEFYLLDRFDYSGRSVKQIGLLHAAKKLFQYTRPQGFQRLVESLKIGDFDWYIAMLKTDLQRSYDLGIKKAEFDRRKHDYLIETRDVIDMPKFESFTPNRFTSQN